MVALAPPVSPPPQVTEVSLFLDPTSIVAIVSACAVPAVVAAASSFVSMKNLTAHSATLDVSGLALTLSAPLAKTSISVVTSTG